MNYHALTSKFNQAVRWNSLLFLVHKISKTVITYLLYHALSTTQFLAWANIYSIIFIVLLWSDLGFAKSIPQYALEFAKNSKNKRSFIYLIVLFKSLVVCCAALILFYGAPYATSWFSVTQHDHLLYWGMVLFCSEGIKSVIKLLYHSYFWQKQFNFLDTIAVLLHTVSILIVIACSSSPDVLLPAMFISNSIANILVIIGSLWLFRALLADTTYQGDQKLDLPNLMASFTLHSGVMWTTTMIQSTTERNILTPLMTLLLGNHAAALFKLANDGALLFQRFIIKTIGTSGTSLFAHVTSGYVSSNQLRAVFRQLNRMIITIALPTLGAGLLFGLLRPHIALLRSIPRHILPLFTLLLIAYVAQTMFMAYERILEVHRCYRILLLSYLPYLLLGALIYHAYHHPLSVFTFVACVHGIRFISVVIRIWAAKRRYRI